MSISGVVVSWHVVFIHIVYDRPGGFFFQVSKFLRRKKF
jgi:hypothetical protein